MPYNEYVVSKLDLHGNILYLTNLTELLNCDGFDRYGELEGNFWLFFTNHMSAESNQTPEPGCIYSFDDGVFVLRYIPVNITQSP